MTSIDLIVDEKHSKGLLRSFIEYENRNRIPLSGLQTHQACYAVYSRWSESSNQECWNRPEYLEQYIKNFKQHSLRNPLVEKVFLETLRVVLEIWKNKSYGKNKNNYFDEIHIEVARDLSCSEEKRKDINDKNLKREKEKLRIRKEVFDKYKELKREYKDLKEYYDNPSQVPWSLIERYEVLKDQGSRSPYTGKSISLIDLIREDRKFLYQKDHIIPNGDNRIENLVLCESKVNEAKSNTPPFKFIKESSHLSSLDLLTPENYERDCKRYFKGKKLEYLLSDEIPERGFKGQQLNDTRHIIILIRDVLGNIVRDKNEREVTPRKMVLVHGKLTSDLKKKWGLNKIWEDIIRPRFERLNKITGEKWSWDIKDQKGNSIKKIGVPIITKWKKSENELSEEEKKLRNEYEKAHMNFDPKRIDHRHHALDAIIVASITKNDIKNASLKNAGKIKDFKFDAERTYKNFHENLRKSLKEITVSFKQNLKAITSSKNYYYKWVEDDNGKKKKIKVRGKETLSIRRALHKETIEKDKTGAKFPIGETGIKKRQYVIAAAYTNLYFLVYWNHKKRKRIFEIIKFRELIEYQINDKDKKRPYPIDNKKGEFLFSLSPCDLVYVPTDKEIKDTQLFKDKNKGIKLSTEQKNRIYKVVNFDGGSTCYFTKQEISKVIVDKLEYEEAKNKNKSQYKVKESSEKQNKNDMIKKRCWKIEINRLGQIENVIKGEL